MNDKRIGLWIDHEKAFIIKLIGRDVTVKTVHSQASDPLRLSRVIKMATTYGHQDLSAERRIEERYRNRLHKYFKKVIYEIEEADKIFIFGPGEARIELKKEMKKSKERFVKIAGIERSDKMTEAQIIAKVKTFFRTD
jgi:hypothetical protein